MADVNDLDLLREFAERSSEAAFAELARRHVNLVYSVALRFVGHSQDAQDVTQAVFVILARKAAGLRHRNTLTGWLYETTRFTARQHLRTTARRQAREQEAYMQSTLNDSDTERAWRQLAPLLEEGMTRLSENERALLALRFLENKTGAETAALLGINEWAAHKRVSRALEKLRKFFVKRGVATTTALIAGTLAARGVQAAPAGLAKTATAIAIAKGATASGSNLALAKASLKLMAWAKAKMAIAFGAGVLLAAGATTVVVNSINASVDDAAVRLEQQSGRRIVCDRHLIVPGDFVVKDKPLEEALDQLAVEAGGYWTVDYAVYDSERGLQLLLAALREGTELESAGWTNLSARPLRAQMQIQTYRQGGGGMRMGGIAMKDMVAMTVILNREASMRQNEKFQQWVQQHRGQFQNGMFMASGANGEVDGPYSDFRKGIQQAMKDGVAEGVLAPERLLAEDLLAARIGGATPVPATPEAAAQAAKAAHAKWTTIYTLRKSPMDGVGIKLVHAGQKLPLSQFGTNRFSPDNLMQMVEQHHYNLSPEERAAHERAVQALKQKQ